MPRQRVCSVCKLDRQVSPDLAVFTIEEEDGTTKLVCENHFNPEDIYQRGDYKR